MSLLVFQTFHIIEISKSLKLVFGKKFLVNNTIFLFVRQPFLECSDSLGMCQ